MTDYPYPPTPTLSEIRLGVARGVTFGLLGAPEVFLPQVRQLGARTVRISLYWSQVEPEPGRFVWRVVDAFLDQLSDDDEAWIQVCSSSTWATRRPATRWFLPPSPANDPDQYRRFVSELVRHCAPRVRLWQCENEPCTPLLWSGTAAEYLTQLDTFWHVVKQADPTALVILGGAPPNAIRQAAVAGADPQAVAFLEHLLRDGADRFDVFDVHLYGDLYTIPATIQACRAWMARFGYQRPVVAGEYNGPLPLAFSEVWPHLTDVLPTLRALVTAEPGVLSKLSFEAPQGPDEPAMLALYQRINSLPPALQMFMGGCPPQLAAKRDRGNCRDLVVRNLLALAAGVRRTVCFQLAQEAPGTVSPYHVMDLLFGKFKLLDYQGATLAHPTPAADTLALLARQLDGLTQVRRLHTPQQPDTYVFQVSRAGRGPLLVAWQRHDGFDAEDQPPTPYSLDWPSPGAVALDVFGAPVPAQLRNGRLRVPLSATPVFVEAAA
jgi:hypothetical protein